MQVDGRRLIGLDAARIFAAVAVMLFHLGFWTWAVADKTTPGSIVAGAVAYPELTYLTYWGRFGVDIFFIVSGFVIAFTAQQASWTRFLRSRFLRLVPAILICATLSFVVAELIGWRTAEWRLSAYLRTVSLDLYRGPWIDGVYWTLGVEIVFYLVVFALLLARQLRHLELGIVVLGIVSAAYWAWLFGADHGWISCPPGIGARERDLFLGYWPHFAVGVLLWAAWRSGLTTLRAGALLVTAVGVALQIYLVASSLPLVTDIGSRIVPAAIVLASIGLIAIAVQYDEAIAKRLSATQLQWVRIAGLATYPLYLIHDVVGAATLRWLTAGLGLDRFVALVGAMAFVVAIAIAITLTVEPLLRRLLATIMAAPARLLVRQPH